MFLYLNTDNSFSQNGLFYEARKVSSSQNGLFHENGEFMNLKEKQQTLALAMVEKLPQLRNEYGFSQTQFGALIGKSRQQLSAIERKTASLSWDTLLAITMFSQKNDAELFAAIMGQEWISGLNMCLSILSLKTKIEGK